MIGITAIGSYLPQKRIDNIARADTFGVTRDFLETKTGMLSVAEKNETDETSDLCCKAFLSLQEKTGLSIEDVDCIVVCTQNPDGYGLPHVSGIVHGKLELPTSCAAFDVSLGCSGYVYGLSILQAFMLQNKFRNGVLLTADPYSKIVDSTDKNTSLLFGDGATATLLSEKPVWELGRFLFGSDGKGCDSIVVDDVDKKLTMNGRAVFTFAATVVPVNIKDMLSANEVELDVIDKYFMHQGSKYIVSTLAKKLDVDEARMPFLAAKYGNTVSSSIPLLLETAEVDDKLVVLAGFGVGLSWGSVLLKRVSEL